MKYASDEALVSEEAKALLRSDELRGNEDLVAAPEDESKRPDP